MYKCGRVSQRTFAISLRMTASTNPYMTTRMCINVARASVKDRGYADRAKLHETAQSGRKPLQCLHSNHRKYITRWINCFLNLFTQHFQFTSPHSQSQQYRQLFSLCRLTSTGLFYLSHVT